MHGPFDGDLANDGESVKLYKPDTPEEDGFVPQVCIDRVKYDDDPPWPASAAASQFIATVVSGPATTSWRYRSPTRKRWKAPECAPIEIASFNLPTDVGI